MVVSQQQDGYATGTLVKLSIDNNGNVLGNYSNGPPEKLARIAMAKFTNDQGLTKEGNNLFGKARLRSADHRHRRFRGREYLH